MIFQEYILEGKKRLEAAKLECADPLLHMKQIVQAALQIDAATLLSRSNDPIAFEQIVEVEKLLDRRLKGEPFQYIVGYECFWKHDFLVAPGVLIPRRETEGLVEFALESVRPLSTQIAELGAGSGIIGISLLLERPEWEWHAWENNPQALAFARKNWERLGNGAQYVLHGQDFFHSAHKPESFDWVIANPPYVRHDELAGLSREVRHEPPSALDGGKSGLEVVEKLVLASQSMLRPGGGIALEIGSDQGTQVLEILQDAGFTHRGLKKDLAGLDRVAYGRQK